jgi:hypothetical protein
MDKGSGPNGRPPVTTKVPQECHKSILFFTVLTANVIYPLSVGWVSTINSRGQTIFVADAHRDDGKRFIVHADEKLSAFVELERQVLTVTFYLASTHADSCW